MCSHIYQVNARKPHNIGNYQEGDVRCGFRLNCMLYNSNLPYQEFGVSSARKKFWSWIHRLEFWDAWTTYQRHPNTTKCSTSYNTTFQATNFHCDVQPIENSGTPLWVPYFPALFAARASETAADPPGSTSTDAVWCWLFHLSVDQNKGISSSYHRRSTASTAIPTVSIAGRFCRIRRYLAQRIVETLLRCYISQYI